MHWETVAKLILVLVVIFALYFVVREINTIKDIFLNWFSLG